MATFIFATFGRKSPHAPSAGVARSSPFPRGERGFMSPTATIRKRSLRDRTSSDAASCVPTIMVCDLGSQFFRGDCHRPLRTV